MIEDKFFSPIASRTLVFVGANDSKAELYIAIGAPYFPARTEGMEQMAACQVLTCNEPSLATEVFGIDEMEALMAALEFLELFLVSLVKKKGGGRLTLDDGSPYDPAGSILLKESRLIAARYARQEDAKGA